MSSHHRPYALRLKAATSAFALLPAGSDPEAFIARQEAMIQAGTHAMIAERLALDAVRNQAERERRLKPAAPVGRNPAPESVSDDPSRNQASHAIPCGAAAS